MPLPSISIRRSWSWMRHPRSETFFPGKMLPQIWGFQKEGKTILFVSHDLGSITKYCDRAILLNQGEKILREHRKKRLIFIRRFWCISLIRLNWRQTAGWTMSRDVSANWKDSVVVNPKLIEYGEKIAEITDYAILDDKGLITNYPLMKGKTFSVRMKVDFTRRLKSRSMRLRSRIWRDWDYRNKHHVWKGRCQR